MPRRFQFSLRALLGLAVVVCLLLGGWRLLLAYGQFVEVLPVKTRAPVAIKGQLIRFGGPRFLYLDVEGLPPLDTICFAPDILYATRSYGFLYRFDDTIRPIDQPGDYPIVLRFHNETNKVGTCCTVRVESP